MLFCYVSGSQDVLTMLADWVCIILAFLVYGLCNCGCLPHFCCMQCVKDYIRLKVLSLVLHGTAPSVKESYNLTSLFVHCFTDDFVVFTPNLGDTNGWQWQGYYYGCHIGVSFIRRSYFWEKPHQFFAGVKKQTFMVVPIGSFYF